MELSHTGTADSMINVHMVIRDITESQADVGVSTVHKSGNLLVGKLAYQVLQAAGDEMQTEVYRLMDKMQHNEHKGRGESRKSLVQGSLLVVDPQNLRGKFKKFMLVCLEPSQDSNDEHLMHGIQQCLDLSSRERYTSIMIPTLGMGGLHYPPEKVALALAKALRRFSEDNCRTTSLKTVYFCLREENTNITKTFLQTFIQYLKGDINDSGDKTTQKPTFFTYVRRFFALPWRASPVSPAAVNTGNQSGNIQHSMAASGNHASNAPTVSMRGPPSFTLENTAWHVKLAHIDADLENLLGIWLKLQDE